MFADDIAVWSQSPSLDSAAREVENAVQNIADWSKRNNLALNIGKIETSFFSTNTKESRWVPNIKIDGTPQTSNFWG